MHHGFAVFWYENIINRHLDAQDAAGTTWRRLTSERKSYDRLPLLCLRLRYHDNVYGRRKCSLLARDYPFVWQRHANPYDFCLLFRSPLRTYMISRVSSSHLRTGCSPQGRTFLRFFSLDGVGMLSRGFFPFRSSLLSLSLSPFPTPLSPSLALPQSLTLFFFLDLDTARNISSSCAAAFFQVSRTSTT